MCVQMHVCAHECLRKSEEGIKSLGAGVVVRSVGQQLVLLITEWLNLFIPRTLSLRCRILTKTAVHKLLIIFTQNRCKAECCQEVTILQLDLKMQTPTAVSALRILGTRAQASKRLILLSCFKESSKLRRTINRESKDLCDSSCRVFLSRLLCKGIKPVVVWISMVPVGTYIWMLSH